MLVIPRKKNETIVLYDNIFVTVIEIRGDKVRLGIEHPPEIPVHRKEVYEAIRRSVPPVVPPAVALPPGLDKVADLAAALQAKLGVPVSREVVARALRDAEISI